jgi:hypothetical protein
MRFIFPVVVALMLGVVGRPAEAAVIIYDIGWTGMTGIFSFDGANAGDGRIDGTELLTRRAA